MAQFTKYPRGHKFTNPNGLTSIVVRQMRRWPGVYIVWGAVDLEHAIAMEISGEEKAYLYNSITWERIAA